MSARCLLCMIAKIRYLINHYLSIYICLCIHLSVCQTKSNMNSQLPGFSPQQLQEPVLLFLRVVYPLFQLSLFLFFDILVAVVADSLALVNIAQHSSQFQALLSILRISQRFSKVSLYRQRRNEQHVQSCSYLEPL